LGQPFAITHAQFDLQGVVVALVEDDPDIRQMLASAMAEWGCQVSAYDCAEAAIENISKIRQCPHLLVCDYRLPNGMTAVHVIKRVRELWGDEVPSLVLTGDIAPEALLDIHASGALLLHKPMAPSRLRTMMYFALHGES
jgi:DNA-binding response OmpR family regulator